MAKVEPKMTKNAMAAAILAMPYGELIKVAEQLADIKLSRLETREDFAKLLHDWADGQ
jgi:hypothetical protein